jgi:4-carboxymuconolactone decarboxylase
MNDALRALVRASAAIGTDTDVASALRAAAAHTAPEAIEEMILQSYLFVGYPRALQAMGSWRDVSGTNAPAAASEDQAAWRARGEQVCAQVYGGLYHRLRHNVARLHPDLERWMLEEGYGKVLGRPGLELAARELCIVALLAVQRAPAQLHSHLRGALNAGATEDDVSEALTEAAGMAPQPGAEALRLWLEVRTRRGQRAEGRD